MKTPALHARPPRTSVPAALALVAASVSACAGAAHLVAPPGDAPAPATLFEGVRVFDGMVDELSPPVDVLVVDGRIRAAGAPGSVPAPAGVERVAGAGRTLLPGLVDCHVHLGAEGRAPWDVRAPDPAARAEALLYSGVTTALVATRDMDVEALLQDVLAGGAAGPWLFRSTRPITATGGHPGPLMRAVIPWPIAGLWISRNVHEVDEPAQAAAAAREDFERFRSDFAKVMFDDMPPGAPRISREALAAVVAEARAYDRRVVAHVGSPDEAVEAAEAGAALLMHVPWDAVLRDDQVERLALAGVPFVTTSLVWRVFDEVLGGRWRPGALEEAVAPEGALEELAHRPQELDAPAGFDRAYFDGAGARAAAADENVRRLRAAGVPLLAGTDSGIPGLFQGPALHRELEHLVSLGIPPAEVLRMATSMPARFLSDRATFGVIAPGARADLLLVEGDPLADIRATRRIAGVWQAGRRVRRLGTSIR